MAKATNAQMTQRVDQVYSMLLAGINRPEILQYAAKEWGIRARQTDILIERANARFEQEADFHRAREFGKALSRLNDLYQRALKVQDFRVSLSVQREIHTLLGLPRPAKLQVIGWRDEVIALLKDGKVSPKLVRKELGDGLADELFEQVGVGVVVTGKD